MPPPTGPATSRPQPPRSSCSSRLGADPNDDTGGGRPETPLHWAASTDDVEVAVTLIDACPPRDTRWIDRHPAGFGHVSGHPPGECRQLAAGARRHLSEAPGLNSVARTMSSGPAGLSRRSAPHGNGRQFGRLDRAFLGTWMVDDRDAENHERDPDGRGDARQLALEGF